MAKVYYDFHLHSCLSPCGDDDMTPYNLVNMAKFVGFDMIALTDHNSCLNCGAAVQAGKQAGLLVVPGMELCTEEEAHVVCLFPSVDDAMGFHSYVQEHTLHMPNDPAVFGRQLVMDHTDNILMEEPCLLINSAHISVSRVVELARVYHGAAFPAHVDKTAYSVIASLGVIPQEAGFSAVEVSANADVALLKKTNPEIQGKILLRNSDAHYLEQIPDPFAWLDLPECSAPCLIDALNGKFFVDWQI